MVSSSFLSMQIPSQPVYSMAAIQDPTEPNGHTLNALTVLLLDLDAQQNVLFVYRLTRYISEAPSFTGMNNAMQSIVLFYRAGAIAALEIGDMGCRAMERAIFSMRRFRQVSKLCASFNSPSYYPVVRRADKMLHLFESRLRYCRAKRQHLNIESLVIPARKEELSEVSLSRVVHL